MHVNLLSPVSTTASGTPAQAASQSPVTFASMLAGLPLTVADTLVKQTAAKGATSADPEASQVLHGQARKTDVAALKATPAAAPTDATQPPPTAVMQPAPTSDLSAYLTAPQAELPKQNASAPLVSLSDTQPLPIPSAALSAPLNVSATQASSAEQATTRDLQPLSVSAAAPDETTSLLQTSDATATLDTDAGSIPTSSNPLPAAVAIATPGGSEALVALPAPDGNMPPPSLQASSAESATALTQAKQQPDATKQPAVTGTTPSSVSRTPNSTSAQQIPSTAGRTSSTTHLTTWPPDAPAVATVSNTKATATAPDKADDSNGGTGNTPTDNPTSTALAQPPVLVDLPVLQTQTYSGGTTPTLVVSGITGITAPAGISTINAGSSAKEKARAQDISDTSASDLQPSSLNAVPKNATIATVVLQAPLSVILPQPAHANIQGEVTALNAITPVPVDVHGGTPAASTSSTAQSLPADPTASSLATPPPVMSSAQLIQSMHQTQMRVGLTSAEFGNISISTSVTNQTLSAQITLDHSALGHVLTAQLPAIEEKLGNAYGLQTRVEINNNSTLSGGDSSASGQSRDQNTSSNASSSAFSMKGIAQDGGAASPYSPLSSSTADSGRLDITI